MLIKIDSIFSNIVKMAKCLIGITRKRDLLNFWLYISNDHKNVKILELNKKTGVKKLRTF